MAEAFTALEAASELWTLFALNTTDRVKTALKDVGNDAYKFERAAHDMVGFYNDLVGTWLNLGSGKVTTPIPVVTLPVKQGSASATVTAPLGITGNPTLTVTGLVSTGASGGPFPGTVTASVGGSGELIINVTSLAGAVAGSYTGMVKTSAGALVARFQLDVVP